MGTEPIRRSIRVASSPGDAFRIFTTEMTSWWPFEAYSLADDGTKSERIVVDERAGGRVYEVLSDGTEGLWGSVTAWEPGSRLVMSWNPTREERPPTEVEVTFTAAEGGGSIVTLTHSGWEALGPLADEARASYEGGWLMVFDERFGAAAGRAD
jgi:uncharacterized protein YndB with AHSA1/START domain